MTRKYHSQDNPKNWPRSSKGHNHKDTNAETVKQIGIQLKRVINKKQCWFHITDQNLLTRKHHKRPDTFAKTSKKVHIIRSGKSQRWKSELKRIDEKTIISNQWSKISESKHHKNINKLDKIHQKGQSNTDMESVRLELGETQLKRVIGNRKWDSNQWSRSSPKKYQKNINKQAKIPQKGQIQEISKIKAWWKTKAGTKPGQSARGLKSVIRR